MPLSPSSIWILKDSTLQPPFEELGKFEILTDIELFDDEMSKGIGGYRGGEPNTTPKIGLITEPASLIACTLIR